MVDSMGFDGGYDRIDPTINIYIYPICSMYGIFTNIYPKNHPNVGKYTIHGAYGIHIYIYTYVYIQRKSHMAGWEIPRTSHGGLYLRKSSN